MLVYGKHPVLSVLGNPNRRFTKIYVTANCLSYIQEKLGDKWAEISRKLEIINMQPHKIDNILKNDGFRHEVTHQGCALQVEPLNQPSLDKVVAESEFVVLMDKVTDPHNVGAIIRSCVAFGAAAVITDERNSPPENATILKTSAGCFEYMPYLRVASLGNIIKQLKQEAFEILALDGYSDNDLKDYKKGNKKVALIVGSEGKGVSTHIRKEVDMLLKIKMHNNAESLNASVATALALYQISGE